MAQSPQANTRFHGLELAAALLQNIEPVTKTTAGAVTYTAEELSRGLILRDPSGANRSDVFPTAAGLYAEFGKPEAYSSFTLIIRNTADAAETITMTTATGLTLSGTMTIAQNNTKIFKGVFTSPTAVTIYSIGTLVH
jgi:hypothetical protein